MAPQRGVPVAANRAKRRSERSIPRCASGRASRHPHRPAAASGRSSRSVHRNSLPAPAGTTSNTPVPRTTRPECRTTHRCGGSHSVIIMVSVNPTGPIPVLATTRAPGPWPPRTRVASIHWPCLGQSTTARQVLSWGTGTWIRAVISTRLLTGPSLRAMRDTAGHA